MKQLRMAIVGAGTWGETHAKIYREYSNVELCAICDMNRSRAEELAQKYGIPEVYSDYNEMLEKAGCDAVAIVTPDFAHRDIAVAAANAKKHILIEKPIATTREDTLAIVEAVERNGVRAMVDLHNRWNPPFNSIRQVLDSGEAGKPLCAQIRLNDIRYVATDKLSWSAKSSILWFLGSHSMDTLCWLMDSEPEEVYAFKHEGILKSLGVDTPDFYMTQIKFKNGAVAQMENGWVTPNGNGNNNDFRFYMLCEKMKFDANVTNHDMLKIATDEKLMTHELIVRNFVFDKCKGFAYESIRSFVDCLLADKEFHVSLREAANVTLSLLAVMESAETGKPVKTNLI